jgi:ABC-type glycerol-3-phosphate transport system substrate-binding protein
MLRGMTMGGMRQGWWPRAALLVGAVIFGGACAPAVPAQPTAPAQAVAQVQPAPPSAESLDALYAAAQKEGQLTIYSTLNTQFGQPLVDKFTQRYPGIKINYNRQQAE